MKTFDGSLTLTTPPLANAKLLHRAINSWADFPLTVTNNPDGTSTVSTTAALPKGVLSLVISPAGEGCCPRCLQVWSPGCTLSSTAAEHSAGSQIDTGPVPSCEPVAEGGA